MRAGFCLLVVLAVGAGCRFSDELPPEIVVRCTRDAECPSRSSCDVALGQCGSLEVDALDGPAVWPALVRPGDVLHAEFALTRASLGTPLVQMVTRSGQRWPLSLDGERSGQLSFSTTVDANADEGDAVVITSFVDSTHHTLAALRVGTTTIDVEPPTLDGVTLRLVPAADNALVVSGRGQRLAAAMAGTAIEVEVRSSGTTEEPSVTALPPDQSAPEVLTVVSRASGSTVLRWVVPGDRPVAQGVWALEVRAADSAGYLATKRLAAAFVVDTVPPEPPATSQAGEVVLEQAPDGTLTEPGTPHWRLHLRHGSGAPAVFQAFLGSFLLLTVDSDSNGAVPSAELPFSTNADALGLRTVDLAGNVSPTVPVLDRQWVQLASRDSTNFHFLSELFEQPCPSPAPATAYSLGDDVRGGWTHRSVLPLTGLPFIDRTFLYWDPIAQRLVAAGSFDKATFDSQHTLVTWERGGWLEDSSAPTHLQGGTMQALAFDSSKGSPVAVFAGLTSGVLAGQGQLTGPEITRLGNYELSSSCGYAGVFFSRGRTMTSSLGIALVFDSRRARVLAFGGVQYPVYGPTDALVVVKNGAVTNVARSGLWPPARTGHSMSYDPVRDLVVLFGGADSPRGLVWGDTWLFDGTHWRQGPAGPPARRDAALAWDPVRRVTVLAGGQNGQIFDDVWEFDGLSWTRRGSVPPRAGAGLAWHPLEQRWFWAGGAVLDAGVAVWSRDTFVSADDGGWTRVVLADGGVFSPLTVPFAQQVTSAGYAYDLAAGRGYAFAGAGTSDYCGYSGCSHFEFNGNDLFSWSAEPTFEYRLVPVSGPRPAPRGQGAFTWSPEHGLVLVGGQSTTTNFGDTWRFADGGWQDLDASVPPRAKALLAWDGTRNRLVLQGGVTSDGGLSAETYEFVDAGWRLASTVGPATAEGAAMTWDPVVGGLVVAVPDAGGLSTWVGGGWASEASIGALGGIAHQLSWLEARRELLVTTRFANQANRWRVRHAGVWRTLDGPMTPLFEHAPGVIASPSVGDVSVYDARDVRPSIHVGIDLPPAVAGGELWSFTARALTGGEGFVDGGWTSGAELTAFVEGTYGRPRTNSAPPQHSAEIEWSTVDRQQLGDLPRVGNAVRLRVTPRGLNGQSTATVRLDDVELRWGFRATGRDGG